MTGYVGIGVHPCLSHLAEGAQLSPFPWPRVGVISLGLMEIHRKQSTKPYSYIYNYIYTYIIYIFIYLYLHIYIYAYYIYISSTLWNNFWEVLIFIFVCWIDGFQQFWPHDFVLCFFFTPFVYIFWSTCHVPIWRCLSCSDGWLKYDLRTSRHSSWNWNATRADDSRCETKTMKGQPKIRYFKV